MNTNFDINKKKRKAQITVFVIIAVFILAGALTIYVSRVDLLNIGKRMAGKTPGIDSINSFVEECIYATGEEAIFHISSTGGYTIEPEKSIYLFNETDIGIAYYLYNNENLMPSLGKIEEQISLYMDNFLYFCTNDFREFAGFEIKSGVVKTQTRIERDKVVFSVQYPLSISKEEKSYVLNNFESEIPVRLGMVYNINKEIMDKQMEKTDAVCLSCLDEMTRKYNVSVQMLESFNESIVFVIRDEKSEIYNRPYEFYFANKYDFGLEENILENEI